MKPKRPKRAKVAVPKRARPQQLKTLMGVRRPLPPARRVEPCPKRTAVRRRIKRAEPTDE